MKKSKTFDNKLTKAVYYYGFVSLFGSLLGKSIVRIDQSV